MSRQAEDPGPLAAALRAWIDERPVTVAHVVRVSGIARNTTEKILNGFTRDPQRATLRALARGIAAHPRTLEVDEQRRARCERDLLVAAGYAPYDPSDAGSLLRFALWVRLGSWARVDAWLAAIDRWDGLGPDDVRALGPRRR